MGYYFVGNIRSHPIGNAKQKLSGSHKVISLFSLELFLVLCNYWLLLFHSQQMSFWKIWVLKVIEKNWKNSGKFRQIPLNPKEFRISRMQMFFKIGVLKNFVNVKGKRLFRATLIKRDSNARAFLWNLRNLQYRSAAKAFENIKHYRKN